MTSQSDYSQSQAVSLTGYGLFDMLCKRLHQIAESHLCSWMIQTALRL